jgi:hypothetical protein
MYDSPARPWLFSSTNKIGDETLMVSVGVLICSGLLSSGLLISEAGVSVAGTGRVGSRPAGYERGSAFLILKRDVDEAKEGAVSLLCPVELENVEPIENRDRHDEPDDDVEFVAVVLVDANDEIELRPAGY